MESASYLGRDAACDAILAGLKVSWVNKRKRLSGKGPPLVALLDIRQQYVYEFRQRRNLGPAMLATLHNLKFVNSGGRPEHDSHR